MVFYSREAIRRTDTLPAFVGGSKITEGLPPFSRLFSTGETRGPGEAFRPVSP